jgi:hypothetical protein
MASWDCREQRVLGMIGQPASIVSRAFENNWINVPRATIPGNFSPMSFFQSFSYFRGFFA